MGDTAVDERPHGRPAAAGALAADGRGGAPARQVARFGPYLAGTGPGRSLAAWPACRECMEPRSGRSMGRCVVRVRAFCPPGSVLACCDAFDVALALHVVRHAIRRRESSV